MNSPFFNRSKVIANDFIQSIVFIDDEVYKTQNEQGHLLDHKEISNAFINKGKICAIYNPSNVTDLDNLTLIAKKADVAVIDWNICIDEANENSDKVDDEDDVAEDDPRGIHSLQFIEDILFDSKKEITGLKVIVVYTGEVDLEEITNKIYNRLFEPEKEVRKEKFEVIGKNFKISVISKSSASSNHVSTEFQNRKKTYAELPDFVLNEFTSLTSGLLSNFALKSLTEIRNNSHKLLSLFSKELDPAYLSHQSLLPNQDDANELLLEIMKDSLTGILKYKQLNTFIDADLVRLWLDENISEIEKPILNQDGTNLGKMYKRDKSLLVKLLTNRVDIKTRFKEAFSSFNLSSKVIEGYQKKNNITLYSDLTSELNEDLNKGFAILTHHKSLFKPITYTPILSLGTVVLSSKGIYYVCIQQRCDSVRIFAKDERRFLFILLNKVEKDEPFDFVTPSGDKLQIENKSYSIRTIRFNGHEDGEIKAVEEEGGYYFKQKYKGEHDEKFEWVFDLKDLHAQRIITNYAAELNRVGLDDFEWIRRSKRN
jgi:hypothetical protein